MIIQAVLRHSTCFALGVVLILSRASADEDNGIYPPYPLCPAESGACGYVDEAGAWVVQPDLARVSTFMSDGLAIAAKDLSENPDPSDPSWLQVREGFLRRDGSWAAEPQYHDVKPYSGGVARVSTIFEWGLIDREGTVIVAPRFDRIEDFDSHGFARVELDDKWGYIDKKGVLLGKIDWDEAEDFSDNGLALVKRDGLYGFIDTTGRVVIDLQFPKAYNFVDETHAPVRVGDMWSFIDAKGELLFPPQFSNVYRFPDEGIAPARGGYFMLSLLTGNGRWGYVDRAAHWAIPQRFDHAFPFSEDGTAQVEVDGKWGLIDEKGEWIVKPRFDEPTDLPKDGLAPAVIATDDEDFSISQAHGYIDGQGAWAVEPRFLYAHVFGANRLAPVVSKNNKDGYINSAGKWVIPSIYDSAENFTAAGLARVGIDDYFGVIDVAGCYVVPPIYLNLAFRGELIHVRFEWDNEIDDFNSYSAYLDLSGKPLTLTEKEVAAIRSQFDSETFEEPSTCQSTRL